MANDPREQPLSDVARKIMVQANYDPHFSGIEERIIMETKLWLARFDALLKFTTENDFQGTRDALLTIKVVDDTPIPMILFCPACGVQHIDKPEGDWTNPPHRSHLCHYCGHIWRPADVATTGVKDIATRGEHDDSEPVRGTIDKTARFQPSSATVYSRPECVFRYCPSVGLCEEDDRCRHLRDEQQRAEEKQRIVEWKRGDCK